MSTFNTLASGTFITGTLSSATYAVTTTFAPAVRADIVNNIREGQTATIAANNARTPSIHVTNPGVFTAGTVIEGTASYPTNDSNS